MPGRPPPPPNVGAYVDALPRPGWYMREGKARAHYFDGTKLRAKCGAEYLEMGPEEPGKLHLRCFKCSIDPEPQS